MKSKDSDSERIRRTNEPLNARERVYAAGSRLLWTLLQVGDDPLLQPSARMGHVRDFWRAIEGTRLLRYPLLFNSLVGFIFPRNLTLSRPTVRQRGLKALA